MYQKLEVGLLLTKEEHHEKRMMEAVQAVMKMQERWNL